MGCGYCGITRRGGQRDEPTGISRCQVLVVAFRSIWSAIYVTPVDELAAEQ